MACKWSRWGVRALGRVGYQYQPNTWARAFYVEKHVGGGDVPRRMPGGSEYQVKTVTPWQVLQERLRRCRVEEEIATWSVRTLEGRFCGSDEMPTYTYSDPSAFRPEDDTRAKNFVTALWDATPKGREAKAELDRAEAKLDRAMSALTEAKRDLEKAEEKILKFPSLSDIVSKLTDEKAQRTHLHVQFATDSSTFIVDREDAKQALLHGLCRLWSLRHSSDDKSAFPMLTLYGIGGSGKTTYLLHIPTLEKEILSALNGTPRSGEDSIVNANRKDIKIAVFLFGTFNQDCPYIEPRDGDDIIRAACARMATSYLKKSQGNVDITRPCVECKDVNALVTYVRQREAKKNNLDEDEIAVFLLVDEVRKITSSEGQEKEKGLLRALLEELNGHQQKDISAGKPTFVVVSSVEVEPVRDIVQTKSMRPLLPVPLTLMSEDSREILRDKLIHKMAKKYEWKADNEKMRSKFNLVANISLWHTGGHFRTVEHVVKHLCECHSLDLMHLPASIGRCVEDNAELATAMLVLRGNMLDALTANSSQSVFPEKDNLELTFWGAYGPITCKGASIERMADNHKVSLATTKLDNDEGIYAKVRTTFLPFSVRDLSKCTAMPRIRELFTLLYTGLLTTGETSAVKWWETTMPCTEILRAELMSADNTTELDLRSAPAGKDHNPVRYEQVVPGSIVSLWRTLAATDSHDCPGGQQRAHTAIEVRPDRVGNVNTPTTCESVNSITKEALATYSGTLVYSEKANEKAIEGLLRLYRARVGILDPDTKTVIESKVREDVTFLLQMKLRGDSYPKSQIRNTIDAMHTRATELGLKEGTYYAVLYSPGAALEEYQSMLEEYKSKLEDLNKKEELKRLGSEDSALQQVYEKEKLRPGTILVPWTALRNMLCVFGATPLLERLRELASSSNKIKRQVEAD